MAKCNWLHDSCHWSRRLESRAGLKYAFWNERLRSRDPTLVKIRGHGLFNAIWVGGLRGCTKRMQNRDAKYGKKRYRLLYRNTPRHVANAAHSANRDRPQAPLAEIEQERPDTRLLDRSKAHCQG